MLKRAAHSRHNVLSTARERVMASRVASAKRLAAFINSPFEKHDRLQLDRDREAKAGSDREQRARKKILLACV